MRKLIDLTIAIIFAAVITLAEAPPPLISAEKNGASGGLTLLEMSNARAAALAEAFTAVQNDVTAFHFNPASLHTLKSGQASFLYKKGLIEDSFGLLTVAAPIKKGGLGFSVGYYNGGAIEIYDGVREKTVGAQTDMVAGLGGAKEFGSVSVGVTGKYLSSEIIEQERAQAVAADVGLSCFLTPRMRVGAALQNFGTSLRYIHEADPLPRIARAGLSFEVGAKRSPATFLFDAPYHINEQELRFALGLEAVLAGALAVRLGYRFNGREKGISIGTGILVGRSTLDYSFGLAKDLDVEHHISYSMKFGVSPDPDPVFAKKSTLPPALSTAAATAGLNREEQKEGPVSVHVSERQPPQTAEPTAPSRTRRIYVVKPGDTLEGIADRIYGRKDLWTAIFRANQHLVNDPADIEVGQKIILP